MQAGVLAEEWEALLESVSTTEGRLAASLVLVGTAAVLGWVVFPRVTASAEQWLSSRLIPDRFRDSARSLGNHVPTSMGGLLLTLVRLELLVATGVALLVLWDRPDLVRWATDRTIEQIPLIRRLTISVVVLLLSYAGAADLSERIADFSQQTEWMTEHQEEILLRVSQLALFIVMGLFLMGVWGIDLGGLLVGAGFLGIVIGFAARQTLGSLIAGFVLMFSRPFTIGDWVEVGNEEGIVTDITIFNTRLENFDGEFVVIPNDQVSNQAITNRSQKGLLRLRVDVGIDYEADPDHATDVALETISDLREVIDAPPPQVFPKSFGDSAVVLEVRFWIDHPTPPRKWKAVSAVISSVKEAFEEEDIKIPYPQRELSGRAETGGFRVRQPDGTRAGPARPEATEDD
jgi:small-conductance mechanosensitive channel